MDTLAAVVPGLAFSVRAYTDPHTGRLATVLPPLVMAVHEFVARDDGQLEHHIDGRLRAIVPPEGLRDYIEQWPACEPVARTLLRADHGTPAVTNGRDRTV
jgi:hypothetical protein